jgi:transposase
VASLYRKTVNGRPYWYLREMARVDGKPKMVSERYLGSAEDVAAALEAGAAAVMPERTRHLGFGDLAAAWAVMDRLGVVTVIDEVTGGRLAGAGASVGTYLAIAAANRLVAPCSKAAVADWWRTTAADRFTRIGAGVLDHRRFWDAMHAVSTEQLALIEHRLAVAMVGEFGLDVSALALDMTNFATYIDSTNVAAPIAQRGKAKQKRTDLRLVGLGLVVTRDGGVPLVSHAYPGDRPDVTQFATVIDQLVARHTTLTAACNQNGGVPGVGEVTVVFDAGQNSVANFEHLATTGLGYIGSVPPSDTPDLLAMPARRRAVVDPDRFAGLTALDTRRRVYDRDRRVILTHSPTLHAAQARGLDQTLTKAGARLDDLAATLARGKTRRDTTTVTAEITKILKNPWAARVISWQLTGDTPPTHRLTWQSDARARRELETEIFGKRVLITDREDWPIADVVAGYRSQSEAEFGFRQLKDPHVVSFSPMHHWTDHNIRVHLFTCVLALQISHLMRRQAKHAGLDLSVRELLATLAGIGETVLIYPSTGGRPKARRMLTETSPTQNQLIEIFDLHRWAPRT